MSVSNTLHVDSFLYPSEEDVDSLCGKLEVSRNHCLNCGAWKTAPLSEYKHLSTGTPEYKHLSTGTFLVSTGTHALS